MSERGRGIHRQGAKEPRGAAVVSRPFQAHAVDPSAPRARSLNDDFVEVGEFGRASWLLGFLAVQATEPDGAEGEGR